MVEGDLTEQNSFKGRTVFWIAMYESIREQFLIGAGPSKGNGDMPKVADNNYLFFLFKYGIFGLLLWISLIVIIVKKIVGLVRHNEHPNKELTVFVLLFWIVLLASAMLMDSIESVKYAPITFFITGLCASNGRTRDLRFPPTSDS